MEPEVVSAGVRVELVFHQVVPAGFLALVGPLTLLSKHGLGSRCQMLSFVRDKVSWRTHKRFV